MKSLEGSLPPAIAVSISFRHKELQATWIADKLEEHAVSML